ncbi:hypothetical protein C8Q76DRAFT_492332 [Earliella scabrosa]|nr:hypothetical protein C8Q76DRAFT_492332 [Earliella scabrosa]
MASPTSNRPPPSAEWKADVKVAATEGNADPTVLPEYTLLPDSPAGSAVGPDDSASNSGSATGSPACNEGLDIIKLLWTGVVALILPPAIVCAAAIASAAAMMYGCGKMLEGIGRSIAVGPELLWRACAAKRAKKFVKALRGGRRANDADVEAGAIAI